MTRERREAATREGFTLVETMAAMVLSAVILMALAPPLLNVAQQQRVLQDQAWRDAVLQSEANRFAAMPFDDLPTSDQGPEDVETDLFTYERHVMVESPTSDTRNLTVIVTPADSPLGADSVVVRRAQAQENPFNSGGSG